MLLTEVFCTVQVEGLHRWKNCPHDEVDYLRNFHRHTFYIAAYKRVNHDDRDVEFIMLQHRIRDYLTDMYYDRVLRLHVFGDMSCEMIAKELIEEFDLSKCEVNEDNENGAIVTAVPDPVPLTRKIIDYFDLYSDLRKKK